MSGCISNQAATSDGLISYEIPLHPLIHEVISQAKPLIDTIVLEELELCYQKNNIPNITNKLSMAWKDNYRLTLCYLNSFQEQAINQIMKTIKNVSHSTNQDIAYFSSDIAFFGKQQDALIIKINDKHNFLSTLHIKLKEHFHKQNKKYTDSNKKNLYSIKESEQFSYTPHVHIGTLYIRSQAKPEERILLEPVLKKIFKRIEQEVFPMLRKIIENFSHKTIAIDSLTFVNLTKRIVHKPYFQLYKNKPYDI